MSVLEYRLSAILLRALGVLFRLLPIRRDRVVLATARLPVLDGNLRAIHDAIRRLRPRADVVLLLEPYGYGRLAKLGYLLRVIRGTYHVQTAGLVIVDNAWLPVHVAPHRRATTVVQVWHAAGALKRFGMDTTPPPAEPERTFLHRHYDVVVTAGEASRAPWSRALRTPVERCLPLGAARTDDLLDTARLAAARARALAAYPALGGRRVVLYAPTFRGRGAGKRDGEAIDPVRLREILPASDVLVLKAHPNLDPARVVTAGFDVVASPADDMNDLLAVADVLVTDYSSSVFEFVLLRRPIVLVVPDLDEYERDPGLYLDLRSDMPAPLASDTEGAGAAIAAATVDDDAYDAFIVRHLGGCDGHAAERIVRELVPASLA